MLVNFASNILNWNNKSIMLRYNDKDIKVSTFLTNFNIEEQDAYFIVFLEYLDSEFAFATGFTLSKMSKDCYFVETNKPASFNNSKVKLSKFYSLKENTILIYTESLDRILLDDNGRCFIELLEDQILVRGHNLITGKNNIYFCYVKDVFQNPPEGYVFKSRVDCFRDNNAEVDYLVAKQITDFVGIHLPEELKNKGEISLSEVLTYAQRMIKKMSKRDIDRINELIDLGYDMDVYHFFSETGFSSPQRNCKELYDTACGLNKSDILDFIKDDSMYRHGAPDIFCKIELTRFKFSKNDLLKFINVFGYITLNKIKKFKGFSKMFLLNGNSYSDALGGLINVKKYNSLKYIWNRLVPVWDILDYRQFTPEMLNCLVSNIMQDFKLFSEATDMFVRASEELMTEKIVNNSEKFLTKLFDKLSEDKYLKLMPYRVGDFNRDYALRHSGNEFSNTVGFSLKNKIGNNILVLFDLSIFEARVEYYDIRAISHHYFVNTFKSGNFVDKSIRDNVIITSSLIDEINEVGIELYKEYCIKGLFN